MLLGVIVFVLLAFKAFNLQLSALIASVVMLIFAGSITLGSGDAATTYFGIDAVYQGVFNTWVSGVAGALKTYFFLLCGGAVFGQLLADGGATKSIAFALVDLVNKPKNPAVRRLFAAAFVPTMYIILSFVGISGFVIVFTVLGIGYELYKQLNVPWRLYCMGGASCASTILVGGAIQASNVAAAKITGTNSLTAGMGISLVGFILYYIVLILMLWFELKAAEKKGEGFMDTGAEFDKTGASGGSRENIPPIILSIIPFILVILLCAAFKVDTGLSLIIGCVVTIALFWKNINRASNIKKSVSSGMVGSFPPLMSVCCAVALGSVLKVLPGFAYLNQLLTNLPPLIAGSALSAVLSFIMASSTSAIPAMGSVIHEKFMEAGLSPAMSHRFMLMSSAPFGIMFHNAGVVNTSSLAKVPYKKAVSVYCRYSCLPALPGMFICLFLILAGVLK
jgi:H+/gluconate symporter-like permease